MKNNRNLSFELLRVIAAFMVVAVHSTIYYWNLYNPTDPEYLAYNIVNCIGRCSVPLFLMISGGFMLQRKPDNVWYIVKKVVKLVIVYLIWSALYATLEFRGGEHTISNWLYYFVNEKFHLWYLPVMAGIYILSPLIYAFTHFENGNYVKYAVIMFFVFGICKSTLISILGSESYISTMLEKAAVELCEYTGYFILGYYLMALYDKKIKLNVLVAIFAVSFIFSLTVTQIMSVVKQTPFNCFNSSFSITNFVEAVSLFLIFKGTADYWNERKKTGKLIMSISRASFGIYLIHPFVLERLDFSFGINTTIFNAFIALPFVAVLSFLCSYIVITVIKKIPVLNQLC